MIPRKNVHQLHFEDLVLLGPDGLEELNDKIEGTIDTLENNSGRMNLTTKIDGCLAPETIVKTTEGDIPMYKLIQDYNIFKKIYTGYGKDIKGNICEVELNFPRVANGDKEWCLITFENNSYVLATIDHQFKTDKGWVDAINLNEKNIDECDLF